MPSGKYQLLAPWPVCLIGWDWVPMSGVQPAWFSAHSRWQGNSRSWRMGNGWQDRSLPNEIGRRDGFNVTSVGRIWLLVWWQGTWGQYMGKRHTRDIVGHPRPRVRNRGRTGWPPQLKEARLRAVRNERWQERKYWYIFCICMSGIMWSFWIR